MAHRRAGSEDPWARQQAQRIVKIKPSEITPEHVYSTRREFLRQAGILTAGGLLAAACQPAAPGPTEAPAETEFPTRIVTEASAAPSPAASDAADEFGDALTPFADVTGFANFYEFTTSKTGVARLAEDFETSPWTLTVGGLVGKGGTFDIDGLRSRFPPEERVYRLRCVEAWSMVIPLIGFPLASLLKEVDPLPEANYVRFETLADRDRMPGIEGSSLPFPYVEGLRIDEGMHDLTILALGLYGQDLLPQNGGPLRLVVPWKYGFKSIKSIVRIELVEQQPRTFWPTVAPREYGFYANVNPAYPHRRWSQATELRIGESERRDTRLFNGYAEQVGQLYEGMGSEIYF
jgi:sulfoxide reductase catalytic subunit YedY